MIRKGGGIMMRSFHISKWLLAFVLVLAGAVVVGVSNVYSQDQGDDELAENTVTETPAPSGYDIAMRYKEIGRQDLAYTQLQTAIAQDPDPAKLAEYYSNLQAWPVVWKGFLESFVVPILLIIASVTIIFCLIRIIGRTIRNSQKILFDVGDFCMDTQEEKGISINIKALIEREIVRYTESGTSNKRFVVVEPPVASDVDLETTILTKDVFSVVNLFSKLFPPKVVILSGVLHPYTEKGYGITLRLKDYQGELANECTLWQSVYDPDFKLKDNQKKGEEKKIDSLADYISLIRPAALWTYWFITKNYRVSENQEQNKYYQKLVYQSEAEKSCENEKELKKIFGTSVLDSSILNYIGGEALNNDEWDKAKKYFLNSLDLDGKNLQALFNLANLESDQTSKKNINQLKENSIDCKNEPDKEQHAIIADILSSYDKVISKFVTIIQLTKKGNKGKEYYADFLYIFSLYQLGSIFKYLYILSCFKDTQKYHNVEIIKKVIKSNTKTTLIGLSHYFFRKVNSLVYLKEDESGKCQIVWSRKLQKEITGVSIVNAKLIKVAYQSINAISELKPKTNDVVMPLDKSENKYFLGYEKYNLACYYSAATGKIHALKPNSTKIDENMEKALNYLQKELQENLLTKGWVSTDPSLFPLRCWKEQKDLEKQEKERLILIEEIKTSEKLTDFKQPTGSGIGKLFDISSAYVKKLKKRIGLIDYEDFLKSGATAEGRAYITKRTGLAENLISDWVKQADLMRIPWVSGAFAKLLICAGVNSVQEFKGCQAKTLQLELLKANKKYQLVELMPVDTLLGVWIKEAGKLPIIVRLDEKKEEDKQG